MAKRRVPVVKDARPEGGPVLIITDGRLQEIKDRVAKSIFGHHGVLVHEANVVIRQDVPDLIYSLEKAWEHVRQLQIQLGEEEEWHARSHD